MSSFFYECPACGADSNSKAVDCCDYCIMTIFMEAHAPELDTMLRNFNSITDWTTHHAENPNAYKE
jgi:hypothetical protein